MNFLTYFLPLLRLLGSPSPADDELDLTETRFTGPIQDLYFFPESDIAILRESGTERLFRSTDVGRVWKAVTDIPAGESWTLVPHPRNPRSLIILGPSTQHWITEDWGNSWTSFQVDGNLAPVHGEDSLAFHPVDGSKIIINGGRCDNAQCERQVRPLVD